MAKRYENKNVTTRQNKTAIAIAAMILSSASAFLFWRPFDSHAENRQIPAGGNPMKDYGYELRQKVGDVLQYSADKKTGQITFIKSLTGKLPVEKKFWDFSFNPGNAQSQANQFIKEYGKYFGANDPEKELKEAKKNTDSLGKTHIRYGQNYNDIPVFGAQVIVHLNQDNTVYSANGKIIPVNFMDTAATISGSQAEDKAKVLWHDQKAPDNPKVAGKKLYIFNKSLLQNKPADFNNYLVWEVELYKDRPAAHEYYYIDAKNGELIYQITGLQDVINRQIYDCSYGDGYCYIDALDPITGYTYGRSEGQAARGAQPILGLTDTDDLYDRAGYNYNYYSENFSLDGANGLGGMGDGSSIPSDETTGLTIVDYYWAEGGYCPNSWFDGTNSIHFCQGETTHDIVGHEYAHAVNYFTVTDGSGDPAGLTYSGESGALNESNSDIFGAALEYYGQGGSGDWQFGEDSLEGTSRDMSDPSDYTYDLGDGATPYPENYNDTNYYCGESDNGGVHINSSVLNHAAYLMAEGGYYNHCTISAIGRTKEEAIFYRAQNVYYTQSTDFNDAYDAIIASCGDLYGGINTSTCLNVIKALRSVEMNRTGYCNGGVSATPSCSAPSVTKVSSSKANGTYGIGTKIDIDVTFSRAVASSGKITVKLETGSTDRTCTFSMSGANTGTCTYTVQPGDSSSDLTVKSITGTIYDADGWLTTSLSPSSNLAANKDLVIDGAYHTSLAGFFRPSTKTFYLLNSNKATSTYTKFTFGKSEDIPFAGDWNGDGIDKVGFFRPSINTFYLLNSNKATSTYTKFTFGRSEDIPFAGDWDGDGVDTVGFFRPSTKSYYLLCSNRATSTYTKFTFGKSEDIPFAGDWNGDGIDKVGFFRPSTKTFYLLNSNKATSTYTKFTFGRSEDIPFAGDWNTNGADTTGIFRPSTKTFYLLNSNKATSTYTKFTFGRSEDIPFAGAWK